MAMYDEEDELFLNRICSVSRLDKNVIVEVLNSILMVINVEIYAERNRAVIPGICALDIEYHDKVKGNKGVLTEVLLEASPKKALINEINCISEGEETTTERYFKEAIKDKFKTIVGVE